jgi:hypothetical protein
MRNKKRIVELVSEFIEERGKLEDARSRIEVIRRELKRLLGDGRYQNCTVYKVGEVRVRGYTRPGYRAMRLTSKGQD